jgi:hypothetical protein
MRIQRWRYRASLVALATSVTWACWAAPQSLAAPAEQPVTEPASMITGTTATFNGELNPGVGEAKVIYTFFYNAGAGVNCNGPGSLLAPPEPLPEAEGNHKKVSVPVTGLEGSSEYTVCLWAFNRNAEPPEALGIPVKFNTPAEKPLVVSEGSSVTPFAATLEAQINPENQLTTECKFEYGKTVAYGSMGECNPTSLSGSSTQLVSTHVAALESATTYHYRVVVKNATGETTGAGEFTTLTPEKPIVSSASASGITSTDARLEAQINPNYQETTYRFEYSTSEQTILEGSGIPVAGSPPAPELPAVSEGLLAGPSDIGGGLTPSTIYYYRVLATNATGTSEGPVEHFTTPPPMPSATTGGFTGVTRTAATLTGTVNPEGGGPSSNTTWCFEYGYGKEKETEEQKYILGIVGIPGEVAPGTENVEVTAALTGLEPNRTYHYRLVAVNSVNTTGSSRACNTFSGYESDGEDQSFTTVALPPIASTDEAAAVGATTATLDGSIVPQGVDARYHFEYGPTTSYGASVPLPDGDAGTGTTGEFVTESIGGLTPNTTYHYRLVATTSGGTTYGWDQAFFTTTEIPIVQTAPSFGVGTAPVGAQIATFPNLSGLLPMPPPPAKPTVTPKAFTRAQRLSKALKQCKKDKSKQKRVACEKTARKTYGKRATRKKR